VMAASLQAKHLVAVRSASLAPVRPPSMWKLSHWGEHSHVDAEVPCQL